MAIALRKKVAHEQVAVARAKNLIHRRAASAVDLGYVYRVRVASRDLT